MEEIEQQIQHWNEERRESNTVSYRMTHSPERCVKCGLCIAFCPCDVLEEDENGYPVAAHPELCVGCTTCAGNCPTRSLTIDALGNASFDATLANEPRAEQISNDLHQQYAEWQRICMEKLGLRWQPVAVSLIDKDELLPDAPLPAENLRFCQAMMAARRLDPYAAVQSFLSRWYVYFRYDRRARKAGHRRDLRAVPQAGKCRSRSSDGA